MRILENILEGNISCQDIWNLYQDGINYNSQIQLVETIEENTNMYIGRQWEGIEVEGLPTIILNFIKPTVQIKVANIISTNTKITVQPFGIVGMTNADQEIIADIVNSQMISIFERQPLTDNIIKLMTKTAITGDGCWHIYWDDKIKTGQALDGDIAYENIDSANVFFGNTACNEVEEQPYIIIERREYITLVKARAKELGLSEIDISSIQADTDNQYSIVNDDNRVTVLTFYYRDYKTNTIKMIECTQNVILQEGDTLLSRYPDCWQNWEERLNDCHGESCVSEMVTNQITINKLATMQAVSISRTAFPTIVYNSDLLPDGWDNSVGAAIGTPLYNINANDIATVIEGANHSAELDKFTGNLIQLTKDINGTNDAMLGNINPENTSAIVAVQKASSVPLELNKQRLFKFLEDFTRICIDFMANYYGTRQVLVIDKATGEEVWQEFDFSILKGIAFNVKIDVGSASYWSEITELKTLDNLYEKQIIKPIRYLENLPKGLLANKQDLIQDIKQAEIQQQNMAMQNNLQSMLQKSPELAEKLQTLQQTNPDEYMNMIKNLQTQIGTPA